MMPWVIGVPSPQEIVAVKSLIGAMGLASVKVPTTVVAGSDWPVLATMAGWGVVAVSGASAITADAVRDGRRAAGVVDHHRDRVVPLLGIRVGRGHGEDHTVGRAGFREIAPDPVGAVHRRRPSRPSPRSRPWSRTDWRR